MNIEDVAPLPLVKIYENLIDHVEGFGPRHWWQRDWHNTLAKGEIHDTVESFAFSELNECGTTCCVAGEVVAMHGVTPVSTSHAPFDYVQAAEHFGVSVWMETMDGINLFFAGRTRDEILTELRHRHAQALTQ